MIETRETHQPLLKSRPSKSPEKRLSGGGVAPPTASYGTLKGEALLNGDAARDGGAGIDRPILNGNYQNGNTPQSVEPQGGYDGYAEYSIPVQQPNYNGVSPLSLSSSAAAGGLPPSIPLRRRVDSSGDRSVGELSTVSGASGHNRVHRSSSDGVEFVAGQYGQPPPNPPALSPTYGGVPPKPSARRSRSPKPPRSRSPTNTPPMGGGPSHPLHQRRASDEFYSNRHRRTHSYDVPRAELRRGSSSNSLYSLGSQGSASVNSETLRLLPDPRWGGGSGGHSRGRSYSGGSREALVKRYSMPMANGTGSYIGNVNVSYSTDSMDGRLTEGSRLDVRGGGYGSTEKEVIMTDAMSMSSGPRRHRRTESEISAASYASAASVDKSVEPAVLDPTRSAMFKDVTHQGIVRLQLPKDNFRLLSDRDLESGTVYKRALVENESDYFQDYHLEPHDDNASAVIPTTAECQCACPNCENCHGRRKPLPPSYYVMAVDADIYRRMFDEVAESMNMPCKLFYCGHHEDVDYPSIGIAVVGVVVLFAIMLWVAFFVDA